MSIKKLNAIAGLILIPMKIQTITSMARMNRR